MLHNFKLQDAVVSLLAIVALAVNESKRFEYMKVISGDTELPVRLP